MCRGAQCRALACRQASAGACRRRGKLKRKTTTSLSPSPSREEADTNAPETRKRNRRPDIQGLRAVAVLMVVAFHAGLPLSGGFVGVDVFFVISGFVITGMVLRERRPTGRIRFGQFYLRRFKRLTPALALMVAVTVIV